MRSRNKPARAAIYLIILIAGITSSCGVYTFTGANISPDIQTISIQSFFNDTDGGPANMGQLFSDKIRDYFQQNTSLVLVQEDGDIQLEGSIVGYNLQPVAPTAAAGGRVQDVSSLTRLTLSVKTAYVNTKEENFDFDRNFSFFSDFDNTTQTLNDIEDQLVEEIFDQIILDIFNATVANW